MSAGRPGVLHKIYVDRDDIVEAGDLLAELDNRLERAEQAIATMRSKTNTKIELARLRYNHERKRAARAEELVKDENIPMSDYQEALIERDLARLELAAAREEQELANLDLARSTAMLASTQIIAPFDGVVVDRYLNEGEFVDRQPVLSLASLNPLYVELVVDAQHYGTIRRGDVAMVHHELSGDDTVSAIVTILDRSIDAASGTFRIRLHLPNPDGNVPSGTSCTALFKNPGMQEGLDALASTPTPAAQTEDAETAEEAEAVPTSATQKEEPTKETAQPEAAVKQ